MPLTCESLKPFTALQLVEDCDEIKGGVLRLSTPFRYPDGSNIDLFMGIDSHLHAPIKLTDLAHTTAYLLDVQIKPWATQKRKHIVDDVCKLLGIDREGGELVVRLTQEELNDGNLPGAMVRLAQACIRIADLSFTQRLRAPVNFKDDVEEFITGEGVAVESAITLLGKYGKEVPLDFRTRGRKIESLLLTLSTANAAAAHGLANEVFRKWHDLEPHKASHQFLTIYDSTNDVFRDDDLARISEQSTLLAFPAQQEAIRDAIAA